MRVAAHTRVVALLLVLGACAPPAEQAAIDTEHHVAPGVEWFRSVDATLVGNAGPIVVSLLRLDPSKTRLTSVLSNNEVVGSETVDSMAARHQAIAAINGGFFNRDNGEPQGLLKVSGRLVSDNTMLKGAVAIFTPPGGAMEVLFDRIAAKADIHFTVDGKTLTVPIAGVDTTRARGRLMLYTPAYHEDTDTAPTGTEWILNGDPLRVTEVRRASGHTPIPRRGAVLSFGGTELPEALDALREGVEVTFSTRWQSHKLPSERLEAADHIVNGAGLLRWNGQVITDWRDEGLDTELMMTARHPRTLIGRDDRGFIWLAAIDGRQPGYSIGMTFADLQRLCDRLKLKDALNLDGGGSTTMVVNGKIVNRPSDPGGARPVSDALLVTAR